MKRWEHGEALLLLHRHPGWGAKRVARKLGVSPSTVRRWRTDAGLAPAVSPAHSAPRRSGLRLVCLHVVAAPVGYDESTTDEPVLCQPCGVWRRPLRHRY